MLADVLSTNGNVLVRLLADENGKVQEAAGEGKEYVDDLMKQFKNLSVDQVASRFHPFSSLKVVDEGATKMEDPPATKTGGEIKLIGGKKKGVKKGEEVEFGELHDLSKIDTERRQVFGWAYVTHDREGNVVVDKSGEFISNYEELERGAYNFVMKARNMGDSHQRVRPDTPLIVGTMIESMVFTPEKMEKMGIAKGSMPTGWWVGFQVTDDALWQAVKEGKRPAFSIHGKAVKKETE